MERHERLLAHIEKWQQKLRLADWDISLFDGEPGDSDAADVHYKVWSMKAEVAIAAAIPQEYEEAQVVHEMLELVMAPLHVLTNTLIDLFPAERREDFREQRNTARHQAIHRLASAFLGPHYESYNVIESH